MGGNAVSTKWLVEKDPIVVQYKEGQTHTFNAEQFKFGAYTETWKGTPKLSASADKRGLSASITDTTGTDTGSAIAAAHIHWQLKQRDGFTNDDLTKPCTMSLHMSYGITASGSIKARANTYAGWMTSRIRIGDEGGLVELVDDHVDGTDPLNEKKCSDTFRWTGTLHGLFFRLSDDPFYTGVADDHLYGRVGIGVRCESIPAVIPPIPREARQASATATIRDIKKRQASATATIRDITLHFGLPILR